MRSRLEARFAQFCDALNWEWAYEPDCFADERGQYLPDFWVNADGQRNWVEVKPTVALARAWRTRMEVIWSSRPDAVLITAVPDDAVWESRMFIGRGKPGFFWAESTGGGGEWFGSEHGHDGRWGRLKHWHAWPHWDGEARSFIDLDYDDSPAGFVNSPVERPCGASPSLGALRPSIPAASPTPRLSPGMTIGAIRGRYPKPVPAPPPVGPPAHDPWCCAEGTCHPSRPVT